MKLPADHPLRKLRRPDIPGDLIQGEPGTGFEKAGTLGEFECENCKYLTDGEGGKGCNNPTMKRLSKEPRLKDGRVKVGPEDCCEFVKRVGRKDKD